MNYKIQVVPPSFQRYDTVGDYWKSNPQLIELRVSDFANVVGDPASKRLTAEEISLAEKYEFLIMMHELIEAFLCHQAGIDFSDIDNFDMNFTGDREPGDAPECPYKEQHKTATIIEQLLATKLGIDWTDYENKILKLSLKGSTESAEQEKEG